MYCIDRLLRIKKYFNFLKENRSTFVDLDYSYLKSQSQTAFESVQDVKEKVQGKLSDSFENQDNKPKGQFDIAKLESIKEKTNKNFFEKMETLKSTKKHTAPQGISKGNADDLMDIDTTQKNPTHNNEDLIDLDFSSEPAKPTISPNSKPSNAYSDFDLLMTDDKVNKPQTKHDDLLLDFNQDLTISKNADKKIGSLIDDDIFKDLGASARNEHKNERSNGKVELNDKDPFDFIAF